MPNTETKFITIGEYVILRQISQQGDWHVEKLEDLEYFNWDCYKSLISKELLIESRINKGRVHPTPAASLVLAGCRSMLGLNRL